MFSVGHLIAVLLTFSAQGRSYDRCEIYESLTRACIRGWPTERVNFSLPSASPFADNDAGWLANAAQQAAYMRESEGAFRTCLSNWETLSSACPETAKTMSSDWWDAVAERGLTQIDLVNKLTFVMTSLNLRVNWERYALTCYTQSSQRYGYRLCYVVDRRSSASRLIEHAKAEELPLRVGATRECTFFVDAAGRAFTADHCGARHFENAWLFGSDLGELRAEYSGALPYSADQYHSGGPFEDMSVFSLKVPAPIIPRAFYHLAYDDFKNSGCEVRSRDVVVCSKSALVALSRTMANTLSFPRNAASLDTSGNRRAPDSVFWAQGQIYFEPEFERFFFHAHSSVGSSGAPVYIPAGREVGGLFLDRPLVLGLVTGTVGANGGSSAHGSDVMSIVAVNRAQRLIPMITGSRAVYATGTSR